MIISPIVGESIEEIRAELIVAARFRPDVLEWRVDLYAKFHNIDEILEAYGQILDAKTSIGCKLMITLRSSVIQLFDEFKDAKYIDLDYSCLLVKSKVRKSKVRKSEKINIILNKYSKNNNLIISDHDFVESNFNEYKYKKIVKDIRKDFPNSIIKIAFTPISVEECMSFLDCIKKMTDGCLKLIAVPMGEHGVVGRLIAERYGSLAIYAYLIKPNAIGQPSIKFIKEYDYYKNIF